MPTPRKNQKQIAQRYAGNLRYFKVFAPLRRWRLLLALGCLVVGMVAAGLYLEYGRSTPRLEWWNSSGGISQAHAGFARDCKQCHDPALGAASFQFSLAASTSIDSSCERCHTQHTFHQVDVAVDHSCVACHHEHLGAGPMQPVKDINCQSCHGHADLMAASAQKALSFPPEAFQVVPKTNLVYFQPPRPAQGYTQVFQSFESDHPAFQIQRDHLSDPNTLKFNHQIHLTGAIPEVNGHKLDCAFCHQPDSRGAYMQSISFEKNCQACHALQIDPTLPHFMIPHPKGDANTVRNFLLTLPTQYALYATQHMDELHFTEQAQIAGFVKTHMEGIRQRTREGADLVQDVFYADERHVNVNGATSGPLERALFPGCAYCHEVKAASFDIPVVTKPVTPDRWYVHARFDHAAHTTLSCEACHGQVLQSAKTSDISLPDKASCVTCHSAKGGVVSTCVTCHGFHNTDPSHDLAETSSLRKMMLDGH